jgi:RNA polymerase sigma-70 factor (ECF subfamily)
MSLVDLYIQKRIQGGDIKEFERLFNRYYKPLCTHAFSIVKDMDSAEDIVQEFFYNFWKNKESFSPKISLNAYLYKSVYNNSLHYLEHLTIKQKYFDKITFENKDEIPAEQLANVEMHDLQKIINSTLQQMPERCSKIFRMNRFEGKKYHEIAEILSVSIKTVEADMGKALQLFRKTLKEFAYGHIGTV